MISTRINNHYQAFLFEVLKLSKVKDPNSTLDMFEWGDFILPEWCYYVLANALFGSPLGLFCKNAIDSLEGITGSYVHSVDKISLILIAWIIQENPEIESRINSIATLAGEIGIVNFLQEYLGELAI